MCGFDVVTAGSGPVTSRLLCSECKKVLKHPVQTLDGIRLCKSCYDKIAGQPGYVSGQTGLSIQSKDGNLSSCHTDRAVEREVLELEVYCSNKLYGCGWTGKLADYVKTHEKDCCFVPQTCPNGCGELFSKEELAKHLEYSCNKRSVTCDYCTTSLLAEELENHHRNDCSNYPLKCDSCDLNVARQATEDHRLQHCNHIKCICGQVLNRNDDEDDAKSVAAHFKNPAAIAVHFLSLFSFGTQLAESMSDIGKRLTAVEDGRPSTEAVKVSQDLSQLQRSTDKRFMEVVKQIEQLERRQTRQSRTQDKNMTGRIEELQSRIRLLEDKSSRHLIEIQTLQTQVQLQQTNFSSKPRSRGNLEQSRLSNLERRYEDIERQVTRLKVHVSEMELQLQASISSTYDGSFMWKIPDIMKHKREAINGKVTSLYSPPFYTAKNGYKMCIRIYLNGDGMGHETHLSLFFVLMKGEFDALLKWPFDHKVSIILVDQKQRKHIVQTFKPTPESSSFQRPVSDMNVASGCPQFCKLSYLDDESYTKDNALFIKCIVDTSRIFHP